MILSTASLLMLVSAQTHRVVSPPCDEQIIQVVCESDVRGLLDLLTEGGSPDASDSHGTTALMLAACLNDSASVDLLLGAGAHLAAIDDQGEDALDYAARKGALGTARILLAAGANPNSRAFDGVTPLMEGVAGDEPQAMTTLLLEHGANPRTATDKGWTALHTAAATCRAATVPLLVASGADPAARDAKGKTPLQAAMWGYTAQQPGFTETVSALLRVGANPNQRVDEGYCPLSFVLLRQLWPLAEEMLTCGADVNAVSEDGTTPLMELAAAGDVLAEAFLLQHSADATRLDRSGRDAGDIAIEHHEWHSYVSALMRVWTPSTRTPDVRGPTRRPCGLPVRRIPLGPTFWPSFLPARLVGVSEGVAAYIDSIVRADLDQTAMHELTGSQNYFGGPTVADWVQKGVVAVYPIESAPNAPAPLMLVDFCHLPFREPFLQVVAPKDGSASAEVLTLHLPYGGSRNQLDGWPVAVIDLDCDGHAEVVTVFIEPHPRDEDPRDFTDISAWRASDKLQEFPLPETTGTQGPALVRPDVYSPWSLIR
ncbi:MAG: ankyrin repeat domain-containing protein [Thermoanaerobaculales bacterium]